MSHCVRLKGSLCTSVNTVDEVRFGIFFNTDYMNEDINGRTTVLSELLNPKYEDLSQARADASSSPSSSQPFIQCPRKPEYRNTGPQSVLAATAESVEASTLPPVNTGESTGNTVLPAAENLEYLGLSVPVQSAIYRDSSHKTP